MSESSNVKFELLADNNGVKRWKIEAIHVTITGNRRKYTQEELILGARSLSYRPLNLNHDHNQWLPYPENQTLRMKFDPAKKSVSGSMEIADPFINRKIETGEIWKLSIEQDPSEGEICQCNKVEGCFCEQKGVIFKALALLERAHFPGDPQTSIKPESVQFEEVPLSELIAPCGCSQEMSKKTEEEKKEADSSLGKEKSSEVQKMSAQASATEQPKKESAAAPTFDLSPLVTAMNEHFKNSQQIMLEKLAELIGVVSKSVKTESAPASSAGKVADTTEKTYFESTISRPAKWFEAIKKGDEEASDYCHWTLNKEEYLNSLQRGVLRTPEFGTKREAITIGAGDKPQVFDKQILILPGGRQRIPLRQYFNVKVIQNADRVNFYKGTAFDVDDSTAEGTEPTNKSQTITKLQAIPALKRAVQTVNYSDIEDMPFDLIEYVNQAAILGALNVENREVLDVTYGAITPSFWVRGDDGSTINSDDAAGNNTWTLKPDGILAALELLDTEGVDTTPGNLVGFFHPHAIRQLLTAVKSDYFTKDAPLTIREVGILERRFGIDIIPTNAVKKTSGHQNSNQYQNIIAEKGTTLGLAVAANLQMEAQRKAELSAVKVAARHRIKGIVIDEKRTVRISSTA